MSGTPSRLELHLATQRVADSRPARQAEPRTRPAGQPEQQPPHRAGLFARLRGRHADAMPAETVTIRRARDRDALTMVLLLSRAGSRLPTGDRIIADVDGRAVAAVDVASGTTVADPARATAEVLSLLRLRAAQLQAATGQPALEH